MSPAVIARKVPIIYPPVRAEFSPQTENSSLLDLKNLEKSDHLLDRRACVDDNISRRLGKSDFSELNRLVAGNYRLSKTGLYCKQCY
jgi:hypothetical protein